MKMLEYVIVDKIPPYELRYLRQNLEESPKIQLIELGGEEPELRDEKLLSYPPENSMFLSMDGEKLQRMKERGMAVLGFAEPEEETRERQERLLEELRYREAMRRVAKTCCVWLGGAAFVLAVIAGYAEMTDACVATGAIALGLTTYGIL